MHALKLQRNYMNIEILVTEMFVQHGISYLRIKFWSDFASEQQKVEILFVRCFKTICKGNKKWCTA